MIYFRGCTAREKETNISKATEELLKLAGIEYHILDDEKCCGSVLLRTGFEEEAHEQIEKNRGSNSHTCFPVIRSPLLDKHTMGVVHGDRKEHDRDIDRLTPTIEKQTDNQQNQISPAQRREKIDCQSQRQICEQKCQATENQSACPPF